MQKTNLLNLHSINDEYSKTGYKMLKQPKNKKKWKHFNYPSMFVIMQSLLFSKLSSSAYNPHNSSVLEEGSL